MHETIRIGRPVESIWRLATLAVLSLVALAPAAPAATADAPGASLEELLRLARQLNPALAAKALETEAALAEIEIAGALDDPEFSISFEDVDRAESSPLPERVGSIFYEIEQTFPLWGKRTLRREIARAGADQAKGEVRLEAADLDSRIKAAFAAWYLAHAATKVTDEIHRLIDDIARLAELRYAQGFGSQQDGIAAALERSHLAREQAALERDRRTAQARINALLNRPSGAPLSPPAAARPLPSPGAMALETLLDIALTRNPSLVVSDAEIAAAVGSERLIEKSWYPDLTVGFSVVDEERDLAGYEARLGFRIPLQWGLRDAQKRQALARVAAARSRQQATLAEIQGELETAYWALEALRMEEALLRDSLIPQSELSLASARASYEAGRADFATVLAAERRLRQVQLDLLKAQFEQQFQLAEIERLIGGDL